MNKSLVNEAIELIELTLSHHTSCSMMLMDLDAFTWVVYAMLLATRKDYVDALTKWRVGVKLDAVFCERHAERIIECLDLKNDQASTTTVATVLYDKEFNEFVHQLLDVSRCAPCAPCAP